MAYETPKMALADMQGCYVGSTPARRWYDGDTLVYQGFSPASEQEFIQQEATGGPAELLKVYGKTIVNNQLVDRGDFSESTTMNYWSANTGVTKSYEDNSMKLTGTLQSSVYKAVESAVAGHIYIAVYRLKGSGVTKAGYGYGGTYVTTSSVRCWSVGTSWNNYMAIFTAASTSRGAYIYGNFVDGEALYVKSVNIIDLTLLYGAGNEPTSVAQYEADYPEYDPTYDPGSLQSNKTSLLRAYDGGTLRGSLSLNLSTLTGKLNGEGASVVVFPDGMRGVGTDRDTAYGSTGEVARAVVDLGTLNWSYTGAFFYSAGISNAKKLTDTLLCPGYVNAYVAPSTTTDKAIKFYGNPPILRIKDSAYTDPATFKTAMSGVMLDYPLATPLTYTLDTPLPTDLTCEQGDILQRVSDNNCPFVGEMKFGL